MEHVRFGKKKGELDIHRYLEQVTDLADVLKRRNILVTEDGRLLLSEPVREFCPPGHEPVTSPHPLVVKAPGTS